MYFNFFKKINYVFNGVSHQVKNVFLRPTVSTKEVTSIRIDNENTPDKSANNLYGTSGVFYINALINNITQKDMWPKTQIEFVESVSSDYAGYAFHILETPAEKLERGDIIVLNSDLGQCAAGDIECYPSYGIIESWDPITRKIWIKNFVIGTTGTTPENLLFKENARFKIFKRDSNDVVDLKGISTSNESAFRSDPNYTFADGVFTMKRVSSYINSTHEFIYNADTSNKINPLQQNYSSSYTSNTIIFNTFVGEYNSGNTNGTCSLIDAYILQANGQTGTDKANFVVDYRFRSTSVMDYLTLENENDRYIYAANRSAVPKIIDDIERQLNG